MPRNSNLCKIILQNYLVYIFQYSLWRILKKKSIHFFQIPINFFFVHICWSGIYIFFLILWVGTTSDSSKKLMHLPNPPKKNIFFFTSTLTCIVWLGFVDQEAGVRTIYWTINWTIADSLPRNIHKICWSSFLVRWLVIYNQFWSCIEFLAVTVSLDMNCFFFFFLFFKVFV